jgi:hypothetical protein
MVTSATKAALLVQSGGLVGMGVSGVGVALACAEGISVAVGISIKTAVWVAVGVGAAVSTGACAPQAEVINTRKRKTSAKFFLIRVSFLDKTAEGDNFIIYTKAARNTFQKIWEWNLDCGVK